MVRRGKKTERSSVGTQALSNSSGLGVESQDVSGDRSERVGMFRKTKMCKFHILGMCAKGTQCRFAHDRVELQNLPDLSRTKLCKTLINTGSCEDPECRYAHSKEELRDGEETGLTPGLQASPTQSALPTNSQKVFGASQQLPNQTAMMQQMYQMMQSGSIQMQPAQMQAMLALMQAQSQAQSAGMQGGLPGAGYGGMGWAGQGMPQPHQGGLANPQPEIASNDDCMTPPNHFGPTPPLSRHGSSNNVNLMDQKSVPVLAAAQLLGSPAKHDSPGMQPANEPAHIPPCTLKSIKSSGSISSMLSGGGTLDTVMEDDLRPLNLESSPYVVGDNVQSEIDQGNGLRRSAGASGSFGSRLHTLAEEDSDAFLKRYKEPAHIEPTSLRSVGSGSSLSAMVTEDLHVQQSPVLDFRPGLYPGQPLRCSDSGEESGQQMNFEDLSGRAECRVKNTFLEFPARPQLNSLRQVHTYSGSLVDMH